MRARGFLMVLLLAAGLALGPAAESAETARPLGDLGGVGTVAFATSCDPAVQASFDRGLALLHSFFYEEARRVFAEVAEKDPQCAIAHWGVAMTYYHPLWAAPTDKELEAGQAALDKALAATKKNEREADYIRAIEAFYKGLDIPQPDPAAVAASCHALTTADPKGRAVCFRNEMERVSSKYADDADASAFYALALLGTATPGDTSLANQKQAAAILEKLYAKLPHHPGLAHYLIHSYDYPPLAQQGLPAAQAYASIAPWVPHALHMPSHIFTRLGMWKETIDSNLASADASRKYAALHHPDATGFEELHATDYAVYGYLQRAQDAKAKELIDRMGAVRKTYPEMDFVATYALGSMPARYALERRQWKEAAALQVPDLPFWKKFPFGEGHIVYARAVGAAKTGDAATATTAAQRLGELVASMKEDARMRYFADQMELQRQAALGLVALAKGDTQAGLAALKELADSEDRLGKHPVSPGALLPIREVYAEALLDSGNAAEALAQFEASLKIYPARFNGVYGAARAAAKADRKAEARRYYQQLVELARDADGSRPEVAEAKAYVTGT